MGQSRAEASKKDGKDEFPIGMRVLAIDDNPLHLKILEGLLLKCGYKVTVTLQACEAVEMLRENGDKFDIVITDVQMPDMDGFKLLELVGLNMDLPVIMLSGDSEVSTVMDGIRRGACDYLVKPVRLEELKVIWKHVIRKSLHDTKEANHVAKSEDGRTSKLTRKYKDQLKEKEDKADNYSDDDFCAQKRPRVAWSPDLHSQFINAVSQLGIDRAVPKRILDLMNVPGLTRENVASHLQKYRKALRKNSIAINQQIHGSAGSNGYGSHPPSAILLSFNERPPDNMNSLERFRVNDYQHHHRTVQFSHAQNSHNGLSHVTSPRLTLPLNHQENLHQQYTTTRQAGQLGIQHLGFPSNTLTMDTLRSRREFSGLSYQSLTPRPNQLDACVEISSHNHWAGGGEPRPSSISQLGYVSNQHHVALSFDNINSQHGELKDGNPTELNALLPKQQEKHIYGSCHGADLDLGGQISGDLLDVQSCDGEYFRGSGCTGLVEHPLEPLPTENMFHLNNCDSADDLHTVLKQFQP